MTHLGNLESSAGEMRGTGYATIERLVDGIPSLGMQPARGDVAAADLCRRLRQLAHELGDPVVATWRGGFPPSPPRVGTAARPAAEVERLQPLLVCHRNYFRFSFRELDMADLNRRPKAAGFRGRVGHERFCKSISQTYRYRCLTPRTRRPDR